VRWWASLAILCACHGAGPAAAPGAPHPVESASSCKASKAETKRVGGLPQTTDTVKKIPNALHGHEEKNS